VWHRLRRFLYITQTRSIARRYFVTNGFDGALTMLGLLAGFYFSEPVALQVVLTACLSAATALGMSGLSSAYVSESAERRKALQELEDAMITDLGATAHGQASRWVPLVIATVNGLAPFLISLVILLPIYLYLLGVSTRLPPIVTAIGMAFAIIFLLGVFLGRVSQTLWILSGLRTLAVAAVTAGVIFLLVAN
jgi:predicted membrane protein (TIGR00267 family)